MAILSNGKFYGFLCSAKETGQKLANGAKEYVEDFVSGFAGYGWKISKTVAGFFRLEIDELVVRRTMTVFELLIQKIRAVKGAIAITQANGKIKTASLTEDGTAYLITLEENDMSFVEHDYFRCQEFNGSLKFYHVEIESVSEGVIRVPASEFTSSTPDPGDEIVQFGNSSYDEKYAGRHSAIYMHADESGQPAIDVMFDIYEKDWTNNVKVRVGGDIPDTNGLKGFYCENGMIKCVATDGHTTYCLHPDGTAELGDGAAIFRPDRSGYIAGGAIYWQWSDAKQKYVCTMGDVLLSWDNLDDETKENLKGESGVSVELADVEYAQNQSNSVAPTTGWKTTAPVWENGKYIWSRTKITYSNNTTSYTDAVCISGGKGIQSITEQYYLSSSPSEQSNGSWSTRSPEWRDKWYMWTRSFITYTDGSTTTTSPICVTGGAGSDGGKGDYTKYIFRNSIYKPAIPSGNIPSGWRSSPDVEELVISHASTFSYAEGFYVSPSIENNTIIKNRVSFTTHIPNQVIAIELFVSSESTDYALIGLLDRENVTGTSNYLDRISGETSKVIYMNVVSTGAHFFDVAYSKDSSYAKGNDNCKYRILKIETCWISTASFSGVTNFLIGTWSAPTVFIGDSADMENIYILQESDVCSENTPFSDPYTNDYVPQITLDIYDSKTDYKVGAKVKNGILFYQAIQAGSRHPLTDKEYWKNICGWTDNPSGVSDKFPYEFISTRKKKDGVWLSFSDPVVNSQMGKPSEDANLLPWIEKWNGYATEIGEEYIVTPNMFSGTATRDENNKLILTGVVQGKDCLTMPDGSKRTGIYALVDNEIVFELDPANKEYKFKGKVEADRGRIAGFSISGNNLSNYNKEDCWISIDYKEGTESNSPRRYSSLGNNIPSEFGYSAAGMFSARNDSENRALILSAKGGRPSIDGKTVDYAIDANGGCDWTIEDNSYWRMPGFLFAADISIDNNWHLSFTRYFGDGFSKPTNVQIMDNVYLRLFHNHNSLNYWVMVNPSPFTNNGSWNPTFAGFVDKASTYFDVNFTDCAGNTAFPNKFQLVIFGIPKKVNRF